jgi:hypothetical protein
MAATILAEVLDLLGVNTLRQMVYESFVHNDPLGSRMMFSSDGVRGSRWVQWYRASNASASTHSFYADFTSSAATWDKWEGFLTAIKRGDQINMVVDEALGIGDQGWDPRVQKQKAIIDAIAKLWRQYLVNGTTYTAAIGATLTGMGLTAVEASPRLFDFDDVHPQDGVTFGTTVGTFKWVQASLALSYKAHGDSYFGPAQTMSAANRFRVPLYSGLDASNTPNPSKWIRSTWTYATLAATGNFTGDVTVAAECVTFTPSVQPTGMIQNLHPRLAYYSDLTGAATAAGTGSVGNGPAGGGPMNRKNMSWLRDTLLDMSDRDPSRCAILAPRMLITGTLEGLVTHLGHGVDPVMFMGSALNNGFAYGDMPVFDNEFIPTNLTSPDGTRTDLTQVVGVVLGGDNYHIKTTSVMGNPNIMEQTSRQMSGAIAEGDGTATGTSVPFQYYEKSAGDNLNVNMRGFMFMEGVASNLSDVATISHVYNQ